MTNYDYTTIPGAEDFMEDLDFLIKRYMKASCKLKPEVIGSILVDMAYDLFPMDIDEED